MLNSAGDLILIDFGTARSFNDEDDRVRNTEGTLHFFSPEMVVTGQKDKIMRGRQIDVWAAGVCLYALASGGKYPYV